MEQSKMTKNEEDFPNIQASNQKTIETGTIEDTIEATNASNKKTNSKNE